MVRRRFDRILPVELRWQNVDLPDPWPEDQLLEISGAQVSQGWLTLIGQRVAAP
jgi:hypothetical protein